MLVFSRAGYVKHAPLDTVVALCKIWQDAHGGEDIGGMTAAEWRTVIRDAVKKHGYSIHQDDHMFCQACPPGEGYCHSHQRNGQGHNSPRLNRISNRHPKMDEVLEMSVLHPVFDIDFTLIFWVD